MPPAGPLASNVHETGINRFKRSAPAWFISLLFHALILLALSLITWLVVHEPPRDHVITLGPEGTNDRAGRQGGAAGGAVPRQVANGLEPLTDIAPIAPIAPSADELTALVPPMPEPTLPDNAFGSARLADALAVSVPASGEGGRGPALGAGLGPGFNDVVGGMKTRGLEVVFVLDATNSMGPYLAQAKQRLRQVLDVIVGLIGEDKVRFGVVAYKDYGDDYGYDAVRHLELTSDHDAVRQFIHETVASGGGDDPEPIHEALRVATHRGKMGWRAGRVTVIILVGDSPVSSRGRGAAFDLAGKFSKPPLRGTINVIDVDANQNGLIQADLQQIADAGGGSAHRLAQPDDFWRHLIVSVFGQRFERDVQTIIDKYAAEPSR